MDRIVAYTFLNICEKIHQFLSSIKRDAHKRKLGFFSSASQCIMNRSRPNGYEPDSTRRHSTTNCPLKNMKTYFLQILCNILLFQDWLRGRVDCFFRPYLVSVLFLITLLSSVACAYRLSWLQSIRFSSFSFRVYVNISCRIPDVEFVTSSLRFVVAFVIHTGWAKKVDHRLVTIILSNLNRWRTFSLQNSWVNL